ncbi:MAG: nucleotide sugar dehydrogenase [Natronohydrobacter sp.]|nr:nucleotide sugar dehydrogenase [Natronohydrobacter sp.]
MKIAVAGLGYVGLANAILLARQHSVVAVDISEARVAAVNCGRTPIEDAVCQEYLTSGALDLQATTVPRVAYADADYIFIATPTNYDDATHTFDTSSIEAVIAQAMAVNDRALMVIKSTVPVGYTERVREMFKCDRIVFSPEFLREGLALHDNLYPSRIIVGEVSQRGAALAEMLRRAALVEDTPVLLTNATEAEAIKLFANTYLATRVALFNEADTLALEMGLDAREVIEGLCLDPRIGQGYNNPSFGYGGYCLPKDSKQLRANFADVPQALISATIASNDARKRTIAEAIAAKRPRRVGIYRLVMKQGSDNFRQSAIQDIISALSQDGIELVIHEPGLDQDDYMGHVLERDFDSFAQGCDVIVANRMTGVLHAHREKVFTRDLFALD